MEARVLNAMRAYKRKIENEALQAQCVSRVNKMRAIVDKYRQSFHPHDFCLWREGVWRIPAIRKVITDGTDEEFNACAAEVNSGPPQPTSQFLEELAAKISALLPSTERPGTSVAVVPVEKGSGYMGGSAGTSATQESTQ